MFFVEKCDAEITRRKRPRNVAIEPAVHKPPEKVKKSKSKKVKKEDPSSVSCVTAGPSVSKPMCSKSVLPPLPPLPALPDVVAIGEVPV